MGRVRQVLKHVPQVEACTNWVADVIPASGFQVTAAATAAPLPDLAQHNGQQVAATQTPPLALPGMGMTPLVGAAVQGLAVQSSGVAMQSSTPLASPPVAGRTAQRPGLVVENLARLGKVRSDAVKGADLLDGAGYLNVFEPYNFNNYYRSLTSYSNFDYLSRWRGWNLNQILGYTDRFIFNIRNNPYIWRAQAAGGQSALADSAAEHQPVGLTVLNGMHGAEGNWNQFAGQLPYPDLAVGATQSQASTLVEAAILGYDSTGAQNFGTRYQANVHSLFTPWTVYSPWLTDPPAGRVSSSQVDDPAQGSYDERYRAIGRMQADIFSTAPELSDLRDESNRVSIGLLYLDPYYVYFTLELNQLWQRIFEAQPSYAQFAAVQAEIAQWDESTDDAVLAQRYDRRQTLNGLYEALFSESLHYLSQPQNRATLQWMVEVYAFLAGLTQEIWTSNWATTWYTGWLDEWNTTHHATLSASPVRAALTRLLDDAPEFEEYLRLNHEVTILLDEQLADHPAVNPVRDQSVALLQDQGVIDGVNQAYELYGYVAGFLLQQTNFKAEFERYVSNVHESESHTTAYDALLLNYDQSAAAFYDYLTRMHGAVAECYAVHGNACDAYTYPAVATVLADPTTVDVLITLGNFYEEARLYWYDYHTGEEYAAVETQASAAMQTTLASVREEINEARGAFMSMIYDTPQVKELYTNSLTLLSQLRGRAHAAGSDALTGPWAAASAELDQKLQRMSELAARLEGRSTSTQNQIFLPFVRR
jgi:hypothetical protein